MTKYEYAAFTLVVSGVPPTFAEWPSMDGQRDILAKANEIGADGWLIFERVWGPPSEDGLQRTIVLWARREKS